MLKTDVDGINMIRKGVLVNTKSNKAYEDAKKVAMLKAINIEENNNRINNLEYDMRTMKSMLEAILDKLE